MTPRPCIDTTGHARIDTRMGTRIDHASRLAGPTPSRGTRHRLAFVLGSGGVRSIAALGVAERLAREGIRPDLVVGCSSGALFGALLAMRMPLDEALHRATSLWSQDLTRRSRRRAWFEIVAPRLARFDARFGLRSDRLIAQRLERAFGSACIEDLPVALRVAATDANSGAAVVLDQGPLAQALRASIAVPVIFPSVAIDGRQLVDGVISDPLPLSAADDAAVVIALGFEGTMPRRVDRLSRLVARTSTALINNLMHARVDAARARGQHVVELQLVLDRHVGLWQTDALPELYDAGRRAAEDGLPAIERLLAGVETVGDGATRPAAWAWG